MTDYYHEPMIEYIVGAIDDGAINIIDAGIRINNERWAEIDITDDDGNELTITILVSDRH